MKRKINWRKIDIKDLACLISEHLRKNNIETVLVGGACVSIYSNNEYLSYDLDFVTGNTIREIKPILEEIGFKQKSTRHFIRKDCLYYIEFIASPVAIGNDEAITIFKKLKTEKGVVVLLSATDCVKDRLAAYYHWNDPQSLEQAVMITKKQKVDLQDIKKWSVKENAKEKFDKFKKLLNNGKKVIQK